MSVPKPLPPVTHPCGGCSREGCIGRCARMVTALDRLTLARLLLEERREEWRP